MSSFCICKSYSHFFSKNACELDIVFTRTVNILTLNELVKLTTLWTTGPRCSPFTCIASADHTFVYILKGYHCSTLAKVMAHTNRNSGLPTFWVIALWTLNIAISTIFSCPLYMLKTVWDIFMNYHTNVKHHFDNFTIKVGGCIGTTGVIYFKRETVFKIWYLRFILNYPNHFHNHLTLKLGLMLQNQYYFNKWHTIGNV